MKDKSFEWWTRKDFESLPSINELAQRPTYADSLVILPTRQIHDSGFRVMHFAVIVDNKPICKLAGCSDVMKLGGTGGWNGDNPSEARAMGWSIDCLKISGLLRLFCDTRIRLTEPWSTFDVYFLSLEEAGKGGEK